MPSISSRPSARRSRTPLAPATGSGAVRPGIGPYGCHTWRRSASSTASQSVILRWMIVDVVREERYWYPDDGGQVWIAGFTPVGADGRFLGRDAVAARGLLVAGVAGAARFHPEALARLDP